MPDEKAESAPLREVVGVFADADTLEAATEELFASGFEREMISLLAGEKAIVEKLGHRYQRIEELEDDLAAPRIEYQSKENLAATKTALLGSFVSIGAVAAAGAIFASGGALLPTLGSGVIGAEVGGFLSGVLGDLIDERRTSYVQEQLNHGGLLLFVRIADRGEETVAKEILMKHSGRDVHAHALPIGSP